MPRVSLVQRLRRVGGLRPAPAPAPAPADAARALHEAEERYRLAARATDDATWDYDLIEQTVRWNDALTRRFGHAPKDLFTRIEWWSDHIHPDDIQRVTGSIEAAIAGTGESWAEEYRFRRADGSYADVLDRGFVIRDESGRGTRMVGAILDLSDRRRAEAALRASEERLRLAQEAGRLGTFEWNAGSDGADVSDTHCEILGLPRGRRITNAEFRSVIHPDDIERVSAHAAEVRAGSGAEDIEFRIVRPLDGAVRWIWISARTFRNAQGQVFRQIGVSEDITERKLAADRLRDSEEMLRLAQEAAGIGSFEWNLKTGEGRGSLTAYRIFGIPEAEKINLPSLSHIIHPDDQDEVRAHILRAGRGETHSSIEHRVIRTTDGEERWLRVTGRTLPDADGDLMRRVGIVEDITDEKLAEARLRESEENYRFTVELSPQLAWTANGDGSCVELKRPITEYPGVPITATFDDWADDIIHPDDATYRRRSWVHSMKTGTPYDCEFRAKHRDGAFRWVRSRGWPRRDAEGNVVKWYGVIEDIHPQRAAEQQLQRLQEEMTQVARVSAMGTLASALAHELNQPLTAVANYMAGSKRLLLNHGAAATAVITEALDNAAKAAVQAGEIVRRLRDLVSRGEVNAQRVEIATLVREACELTLGDDRRSIDLSLDFDPQAKTVMADRIQLQQVLVNLVRNAAEAMDDREIKQLRLSVKPSGPDQAVIRVEDSGTGVAAQVKRHLFSPFVTTKETGMGVGLSICRSIVEAHGGQLWVEDAPGGGAAFCFTLRRAT